MPLCSQLQLPGVAGLGVFDAGYHVDRHSEVDQGAPRGDNYKSLTFTPTQTTICPRHVRYPLFNADRPIFFVFSTIDPSRAPDFSSLPIFPPGREKNRGTFFLSTYLPSYLSTYLPIYLPEKHSSIFKWYRIVPTQSNRRGRADGYNPVDFLPVERDRGFGRQQTGGGITECILASV